MLYDKCLRNWLQNTIICHAITKIYYLMTSKIESSASCRFMGNVLDVHFHILLNNTFRFNSTWITQWPIVLNNTLPQFHFKIPTYDLFLSWFTHLLSFTSRFNSTWITQWSIVLIDIYLTIFLKFSSSWRFQGFKHLILGAKKWKFSFKLCLAEPMEKNI